MPFMQENIKYEKKREDVKRKIQRQDLFFKTVAKGMLTDFKESEMKGGGKETLM